MKQIKIVWSTDDVLAKSNDMGIPLTEAEAETILDDLERHHDAQIGVNWDVIASYIYQYQEEIKESKLTNDLYERSAE